MPKISSVVNTSLGDFHTTGKNSSVNIPGVNDKAFTCLKRAVANKWLNETTEVASDIKHHHADQGD